MANLEPLQPARAPRVSVIVPVYNGAAYLAQALDSALTQTWSDLEILVVNDGSTDASSVIAHLYAKNFPDQVRVFDQANTGLPGARNTALRNARGDFFALLDADDVWMPEHLELAMAAFAADTRLGLVHANIRRIDARGNGLGIAPRFWRAGLDAYTTIALRHEHVNCPTAVFTRAAIEAVGPFDTDFTGLGCEDRDLWLRIAARFPLRHIDAVTADYRVHAGSMSRNRAKMLAARELLARKHASTSRGKPLLRHMRAMVQSDLGMELLEEGDPFGGIRTQLKAMLIRPQTGLIWRRLLKTTLHAFLLQQPLTGNAR